MKINIWIRHEALDDLAYFISDNFQWDRDMKFDVWYSFPTGADINEILSVSLSYDQYKKLEDL